jgi:transcriptional regulator with XRE-family HTH domain
MNMTPAPKQKRKRSEGALFPRDFLAAKVRATRGLHGLGQQDLAERMSALGHEWSRPTVSQVERAARTVSVDELFGLCLALQLDFPTLLAPLEGLDVPMDVGLPKVLGRNTVRGMLSYDSPWRPTVTWEGNKPAAVKHHGLDLLGRIEETGATPEELDWIEHQMTLQRTMKGEQL